MNSLKSTKIVFFGTSDFAVPIFNALTKNAEVIGLVTQPDRPVGRHQELEQPPILKKCALDNPDLHIFQFESLKDAAVVDELRSLNADLFVVAAYGNIIPQAILDIPKLGCINVHGSLLPKYRGASPIHAVLLNGERFTGNTIMMMDAVMDHGAILAQSKVAIEDHDDFKSLEAKMADDGAKLLIETLEKYVSGSLKPVEQNHNEATYTKILKKSDGLVDWNKTANQIYDQYRAFKEWPGLYTFVDYKGKTIRLKLDELIISYEPVGRATIEFNGDNIIIGAGEGSVQILKGTLEGKKTMTAKEFINGHQELNHAICKNPPND